MNLKLIRQGAVVAAVGLVASALSAAAATAAPAAATGSATMAATGSAAIAATGSGTTTPIKHVVVIIGENHSFDNVFATYQPPGQQHIWNLMSEGNGPSTESSYSS